MYVTNELLNGIYAYWFEKPSAIQQRAIVPWAAQAQSGTGKIATVAITVLQIIDTSLGETQVLVSWRSRFKCVMVLEDYVGTQCHAWPASEELQFVTFC